MEKQLSGNDCVVCWQRLHIISDFKGRPSWEAYVASSLLDSLLNSSYAHSEVIDSNLPERQPHFGTRVVPHCVEKRLVTCLNDRRPGAQ